MDKIFASVEDCAHVLWQLVEVLLRLFSFELDILFQMPEIALEVIKVEKIGVDDVLLVGVEAVLWQSEQLNHLGHAFFVALGLLALFFLVLLQILNNTLFAKWRVAQVDDGLREVLDAQVVVDDALLSVLGLEGCSVSFRLKVSGILRLSFFFFGCGFGLGGGTRLVTSSSWLELSLLGCLHSTKPRLSELISSSWHERRCSSSCCELAKAWESLSLRHGAAKLPEQLRRPLWSFQIVDVDALDLDELHQKLL